MGRPNSPPRASVPPARPVEGASRPRPPAELALLVRANPGLHQDLEAAWKREAARRERTLALRLWLAFFTPRGVRRLIHYVVGSVLVLPLLNVALTPLAWRDIHIQLGAAAGFGVVMALARPRGISVGFLLAGTAFGTLWAAGYVHSLVDVLHLVLALLCYFGLGLALGISENVVRHGE